MRFEWRCPNLSLVVNVREVFQGLTDLSESEPFFFTLFSVCPRELSFIAMLLLEGRRPFPH